MSQGTDKKLERCAERLERAAGLLESGAERLEATADSTASASALKTAELEEYVLAGLEEVTDAFLGSLDGEMGRIVGGLVDIFSGLMNPGWGLVGDLLSIFGFAEGGYVSKPTLALVGEGGHPEYVIPEPAMAAALSGGIPGVIDLLSGLGGDVQRGSTAPAPSSTSTTNVYNSYGLAVGSLDRLDAYARRADARRSRRAYA